MSTERVALPIERLKLAIRPFLLVAIVGFSLTMLAGCGIDHGPYRHGFDGRNYYHNSEYSPGGYGYSGNPSPQPYDSSGSKGYYPIMDYRPSRSGYCAW